MPPTNQVGSPFSIVHVLEPPPDVVLATFFGGALSSGPESESEEEELSRLFLSFGIVSVFSSNASMQIWKGLGRAQVLPRGNLNRI